MITDLTALCVRPESSLQESIAQMNSSRAGIVLVVDKRGRLVGTITDGDVRRAMLANVNIDSPVSLLLEQKASTHLVQPITESVDADSATMLNVLRQHAIRHLPLVDQDNRVVGLVTLDDFVPKEAPPLQAVIMAGGYGTRLQPLTNEIPKSMLPVGDRPILELIIDQLRDSGISRVSVTTHYMKDAITNHFGDGRDFGVDIQYVEEDQPLGTAGALSLLENFDAPMLVINGDILTQVDFRNMLDFHREHEADMSVAIRLHEFTVPYGVVTTDGVTISGISEKPVIQNMINAGIYLLNPSVQKYIPSNQAFDMPDLISKLLEDSRRVVGFPVGEYWIDIGQVEDYQRARADVASRETSK